MFQEYGPGYPSPNSASVKYSQCVVRLQAEGHQVNLLVIIILFSFRSKSPPSPPLCNSSIDTKSSSETKYSSAIGPSELKTSKFFASRSLQNKSASKSAAATSSSSSPARKLSLQRSEETIDDFSDTDSDATQDGRASDARGARGDSPHVLNSTLREIGVDSDDEFVDTSLNKSHGGAKSPYLLSPKHASSSMLGLGHSNSSSMLSIEHGSSSSVSSPALKSGHVFGLGGLAGSATGYSASSESKSAAESSSNTLLKMSSVQPLGM